MMTFMQKFIAFGTILFLNLLVLLFMGGFVIFTLIPSLMMAAAVYRL